MTTLPIYLCRDLAERPGAEAFRILFLGGERPALDPDGYWMQGREAGAGGRDGGRNPVDAEAIPPMEPGHICEGRLTLSPGVMENRFANPNDFQPTGEFCTTEGESLP